MTYEKVIDKIEDVINGGDFELPTICDSENNPDLHFTAEGVKRLKKVLKEFKES